MKVIKDGRVEPVMTNKETEASFCIADEPTPVKFDLSLTMIKPVLKRSLYHYGQPVILTFKSFEVWLIQQTQSTVKISNPIYIPLHKVEELITMEEG